MPLQVSGKPEAKNRSCARRILESSQVPFSSVSYLQYVSSPCGEPPASDSLLCTLYSYVVYAERHSIGNQYFVMS